MQPALAVGGNAQHARRTDKGEKTDEEQRGENWGKSSKVWLLSFLTPVNVAGRRAGQESGRDVGTWLGFSRRGCRTFLNPI